KDILRSTAGGVRDPVGNFHATQVANAGTSSVVPTRKLIVLGSPVEDSGRRSARTIAIVRGFLFGGVGIVRSGQISGGLQRLRPSAFQRINRSANQASVPTKPAERRVVLSFAWT